MCYYVAAIFSATTSAVPQPSVACRQGTKQILSMRVSMSQSEWSVLLETLLLSEVSFLVLHMIKGFPWVFVIFVLQIASVSKQRTNIWTLSFVKDAYGYHKHNLSASINLVLRFHPIGKVDSTFLLANTLFQKKQMDVKQHKYLKQVNMINNTLLYWLFSRSKLYFRYPQVTSVRRKIKMKEKGRLKSQRANAAMLLPSPNADLVFFYDIVFNCKQMTRFVALYNNTDLDAIQVCLSHKYSAMHKLIASREVNRC